MRLFFKTVHLILIYFDKTFYLMKLNIFALQFCQFTYRMQIMNKLLGQHYRLLVLLDEPFQLQEVLPNLFRNTFYIHFRYRVDNLHLFLLMVQ